MRIGDLEGILGALGAIVGGLAFLAPPESEALGRSCPAAARTVEESRVADSWRTGERRQTPEHKRLEDSLSVLAEAGRVLVSSLDYETTLASVARLVVPRMADWCSVDVIGDGGSLLPLAVVHADPARVERVRQLQSRYPSDPNVPHGVPRVLRTGESELYPELSDELLAGIACNEEHLEMLRALGLCSAMVVPLVARGRTLGAIGFAAAESGRRFDRTDLALAEDLARLAALAVDNARLYRDARRATHARDEFLSVAAHELRTPMTSLRGFAQLALRQSGKEGTGDQLQLREALQMIDHQSKKLCDMISRMLDVSRAEAGRLKLDRQVVDLARLVEKAVAAARPNACVHTFALRLPPSALAVVDPLLVGRVVANLLDNAIRYSPDGGAIDVEVSTPEAETVRLVVRDRGIGVPAEQRQRIFERYSQATSCDHLGGMGLGLYISREIVHLHGGTIVQESPTDGGARFVVTLPTGFGASAGLAEAA